MARLLVCTDGSPAGEGALAGALALARLLGSKLDLLQVIEVPLGYAGLTSEAVLKRWEREVRDYLEGVRIKAEPLGVRVEPRVGFGDAAFAVIVDEAKKIKPDLLLIGRMGKTRLAQLLMGSTTARVIGLSPVSVLVVPKDATLGLSRLLVASDGSPFGDAAFEAALALAKRMESALFGLSVALAIRVVDALARVDGLGRPVSGVAISGAWGGAITAGDTARTTDAAGTATFYSARSRNPGTVTFCVSKLAHSSLVYDAVSNVETCDAVAK